MTMSKSGPPPIEVRGLRKVFRQATSGQAVVAIDRLDLTIAPREVVAIVGQTGCGKSTFFDLADRPRSADRRLDPDRRQEPACRLRLFPRA